MVKILACIAGILMLAILLLRFLPFIPLEIKIEWITNLGLVLMFVTGGAAFAFVRNALIAVIIGAVTFAIIQALLQTISQMIGG
ncbi:MAG: hypothetical protein JW732_03665 [Dehalococcoidia bacterium]|nr:hypothetical protein [Dehalococcoidia bacterium]